MDLSLKKRIPNILSREQPGEKGLFLKRIGALLTEGYSIKEALTFLLKIENKTARKWILNIQEGLMTGNSFHNELEQIGFSDKVCSQIYLASQYGNYGRTITQCGEQLLEDLKKRKKFQSLISYPLFLLLFLLGMLLLMRYLILPHMEVLFMSTGSNQDMYANNMVLLVYYSPQLIGLAFLFLALGYLILNTYLKSKSMIGRIQFFMKVPLLKNILKDYYSHFFFFEWGQLLQNGCSFQEIVQIMQGEDSAKILKETGGILSKQMLLGHSIEEAVRMLPFFYEEGYHVISHGENLGKLGTEMLVYANYCENQLNMKVEKTMERMQPFIFSLIAMMIVAIYSAMMLPIFSLMEGF